MTGKQVPALDNLLSPRSPLYRVRGIPDQIYGKEDVTTVFFAWNRTTPVGQYAEIIADYGEVSDPALRALMESAIDELFREEEILSIAVQALMSGFCSVAMSRIDIPVDLGHGEDPTKWPLSQVCDVPSWDVSSGAGWLSLAEEHEWELDLTVRGYFNLMNPRFEN